MELWEPPDKWEKAEEGQEGSCQPSLSPWEGYGLYPPVCQFQPHEGQEGVWELPGWFFQEKIMSDQQDCLP